MPLLASRTHQPSDAIAGFEGGLTHAGLWGEISAARSEQGASDYWIGTIGFYGQISDTALAGLMGQFDEFDQEVITPLDGSQATLDGRDWLLGAYFAARHPQQPLYFEGRLLQGATRNQARFLKEGALRTGAFGTQGCLGQFRMEGDALLEEGEGQIQIFPHFDVVWFEDKAGGFTDDQETRVSGQTLPPHGVCTGN